MVRVTSGDDVPTRIILGIFNVAMALMFGKILLVFREEGWEKLTDNEVCDEVLRPRVLRTLGLSFVEVMNASIGMTRSNPGSILLFFAARLGIERFVTPAITCGAWQHLVTVLFWASGETIRFTCFILSAIFPESSVPKYIRYTLGPIMFTCGTVGEILMLIRAAYEGRPLVYIAVALWPVGFYSLMKQLLEQRRKHLLKNNKPEVKRV
uniref:very-long-chain (3R)-3-hydroxyacyl-CoA dehydratase n=1 Tax=Cyclophora tenuis TaxID=216820 RepID=A0A7S1GM26_CYCTE|mmetsp:Transcript_2201/g.3860  ORF Transcript_2201/g.3860 Transcript_2201/m.3860 type:complete len:209 (+) Transcript_2201:35-661(+)